MSDQPRNPAEAQADELDRLHARGWTGADQQAQELTERYTVELVPCGEVVKGDEVVVTGALGASCRAVFSTLSNDEDGCALTFTDADSLYVPSRDYLVARVAARVPVERPDEGVTEAMVEALATLICGEAYIRHENRDPPCAPCRRIARRYLKVAHAARLPERPDERLRELFEAAQGVEENKNDYPTDLSHVGEWDRAFARLRMALAAFEDERGEFVAPRQPDKRL